MSEKLKKSRWHSCNVLQVSAEARQIWQFDARNGAFVLNRQQTSFAGEPLPARLVAKDWRTLWQPRLNIAWLSPEQVFLRVAQFPASDFNETLAMVELQLEKLSPMPVAQIVWSIQTLPQAQGGLQTEIKSKSTSKSETLAQAQGGLQTVIVSIIARNVVEEFLGQLEGQGYLADRLELPLLDQLQATPITGDGAWVYPETSGSRKMALVAWWYGGVLQILDLVTWHPANPSAGLREQLLQMAWAGELEGWLTSPPVWHLVADGPEAAEWEPALRQGLEQPLELQAPVPPPDLAALTARRAAQAEPKANLLPAEFSTRYQQQLVDRLWMRGLLAIGVLYLVGVAIYGVALGVAVFRTRGVENEAAALSGTYTNAIQLKARFQVLKDRQDLKYAALNCWKTVAELMPESLTLESWNFSEGKRLALNGTAPSAQVKQVVEFEAAMRKATIDGQPLFDGNKGEGLSWQNQGPAAVSWKFSLELKRGEAQ